MDQASRAPGALGAASLEPPRWKGGEEDPHAPFGVVAPFSEKISAKSIAPEAFAMRPPGRAEASVPGEVPNLGRRPRRATCFAQCFVRARGPPRSWPAGPHPTGSLSLSRIYELEMKQRGDRRSGTLWRVS